MEKIITIMDYNDKKTDIKIDNFEDVVRLSINVVTGDEILNVLYKDYSEEEHDSNDYRMSDLHDDSYCIYDTTKDIDYIENWNKRESSYDYNLEGENE